MSEITTITYSASIMPCRIYQDASMRTTFSASLDNAMNAVQAVLTQWMMNGEEVIITISLKNQIAGTEMDNGKAKRRRNSKAG